jgi:phosphoenolpyruvate carboxylase
VHAGIANDLFSARKVTLYEDEEGSDVRNGRCSYQAYASLRDHAHFTEYLTEVSPLQFYGETNIGSRPTKRKNAGKLELKDLRVIPLGNSAS